MDKNIKNTQEKSRPYKYSMTGLEYEKLQELKRKENRKLRPWVKIAGVLLVAATIAHGANDISNNRQYGQPHEITDKEIALRAEARDIAYEEAGLSDCVDVVAEYNSNAIDIMADSLRGIGVKSKSDDKQSNKEFLKKYIDEMENAYNECDFARASQYAETLRAAIKNEALPRIVYRILEKSNVEKPNSYKDIIIESDKKSNFLRVYYKMMDKYGTEHICHIGDNIENSPNKLPNNFVEMVFDTESSNSRHIDNLSHFSAFVSDLEELLVDYVGYKKEDKIGISVNNYFNPKTLCNQAHNKIMNERYTKALASKMVKEGPER